jgi:CHAT domain-containing protein/Tfp pilus assembly protein PilF
MRTSAPWRTPAIGVTDRYIPRLNVIIACILACCCCGARHDATDHYRNAVQAFRDARFAQALTEARDVARTCSPDTECHWSARLLEAQVLLSDKQVDAAALVLSEEPPQSPGFASLTARRKWLQGDLQVARSHYELAEELYSSARQLASAAGASDLTSDIDLSRARLLFLGRRRDTEGAKAVFHDVAQQSARRGNAYYEAFALNGLGMLNLKDWRFDEAIPWFQQTVQAANKAGAKRLVLAASNNLMICYYRLGSFNDAAKLYQQTLELAAESGPQHMELLAQMGNTLLYQGKIREAIEYYRQAVSFAKTDADAAKYYRNIAAANTSIQDWDAAEKSINQALSHGHDAASRPWTENIQAGIAAGRNDYDEACRLYRKAINDGQDSPEVLWESHAALAEIYARQKSYRQADEEFAQTIGVIDDNAGKIATADYSLTFFSSQMRFYHDYIRALIARHEYQRALDIADSTRARLLLQHLELRRKHKIAAAVDYQAIARRLNSVLLFYLVMPEQSYLWIVTPRGVQPPVPLPPADQLRGLVDQYRTFVEQKLGDPIVTPNEAGRRLYDVLVAPAKPFTPADSRVILFPDDALNWLNFETLPVYGDSPGERPHYWIEDVRTEIAPSLRVLGTEEPSAPHRPDSLLMIGDPVSPNREFPTLEYAAKEIAVIEAHFPDARKSKFMREVARPATYRSSHPESFSLVHFSAHAVANKESPLDSAIILSSDGDNFKLYARNVIGMPLKADLVTISACRSAGARSYLGEGLVGFAWAFLQAGAHNVIAGLWDVTDSSTPGMMDVLYSKIADGVSPADALRAAKLQMIQSARGYRRPYYWGPFQIYTR